MHLNTVATLTNYEQKRGALLILNISVMPSAGSFRKLYGAMYIFCTEGIR